MITDEDKKGIIELIKDEVSKYHLEKTERIELNLLNEIKSVKNDTGDNKNRLIKIEDKVINIEVKNGKIEERLSILTVIASGILIALPVAVTKYLMS